MQQCLPLVGTLKGNRVLFLLYSLGINMILVPLRDVKTERCGALQLVTMMKIANGDFAQIKVESFLLFLLFINVQHFFHFPPRESKTQPGMDRSFNGAKQGRGQTTKYIVLNLI